MRSIPTKLQNARTQVQNARVIIASLQQELAERRLCGQTMSNLCHYAAPTEFRESIEDCLRKWDEIQESPFADSIPGELRPKRRAKR